MELFFPLPGLESKNFFYKVFLIFIKEYKEIFKPGNGFIPTGNGICSPTSGSLIKKHLLQDVSRFFPRSIKCIFKTGNGIIQTGNGIISPTSRPLIKTLLLEDVSHFFQGVKMDFQNRK